MINFTPKSTDALFRKGAHFESFGKRLQLNINNETVVLHFCFTFNNYNYYEKDFIEC